MEKVSSFYFIPSEVFQQIVVGLNSIIVIILVSMKLMEITACLRLKIMYFSSTSRLVLLLIIL